MAGSKWLGALCILLAPAAAIGQPPAPLEFDEVEFRPLANPKTVADSATLVVPERRGAASGRTLSLPVIRFRSPSERPAAPVVYLAGGPGGSGIGIARTPRFQLMQEFREVADVVTFDQRGTGGAKPAVPCRAIVMFPRDKPGDKDTQLKTLLERCRACADRLRSEGHDLAAYNTNESADDIEDLRAALGADKITLWGTSYGTHLALAYLRRYPTRVDRLILAGVEGPDHTLKLPGDQQKHLEKMAALVKADPHVSRSIPDFLQLVKSVLDRLERRPEIVHLERPGNPPRTVAIGKWDLQRLTAEAMGRTQTAKVLPSLYDAMSRGDFSRVAPLVIAMRTDSLPSAMSFVMDCASGASPERLKQIERESPLCLLGDAVNFPFPAIGAAWSAPDLGAEFRAPLRSDVPALFISGSLDARTPPANAEEILRGFPHGLHLLIEGAGHGDDLFADSQEMRQRMVAFAAGQSISTEPIRLPPLRFDWPDRP